MKYHKYLNKQIKKHIPSDWHQKPEFVSFLNAINDTFIDYEKDKILNNHAFKISEEEFIEVNKNLKANLKKQDHSLKEIKQALEIINPNVSTESHTDILNIAELLNTELSNSKALKDLNEKILITSLNAIICFDIEGSISYWNPAAEYLFGYKEAEAKKIPFSQLIAEPCRTHFGDGIKAYFDEGNREVFNGIKEAGGITQKGDIRNLEMHVFPVENEAQVWFCAFIQDKTESFQASKKLKLQEERYRNMINNINLGLIEVDNDEKVIFLNQSFSNISGYSPEELVGKRLSETLQLSKESIKLIQEKKEMRNKGVSDQYEIMVKNKNGEVRWWVISGSPSIDDEGNIKGSVGIHLDVTERKKLENKLRQAKEEAEKNLNIKESILNTMSHEIRTPLNGIVGMLQELSQHNLPTESQKPLEYSMLASDHLMSIVNNILDYSKLEAGQAVLHYEPHDFQISLSKISKILDTKLREKNLSLVVENQLTKFYQLDSLKVEQILFNIIGNAIKFTDKGTINVQCSSEKATDNKEYLTIKIQDTGIGMNEETVKNIFSKYSQAKGQKSSGQKGTGLGMAITKELVDLMKGSIEVESTINQGTTFTLSLPVEIYEGELIPGRSETSQKYDFTGKSVLVVDDAELNLIVAENTLKPTNAQISFAKSAEETLSKLENDSFDLILLDLFLPDINGDELSDKILNELNYKIPIIGMSANSNSQLINSCLEKGMQDYVLKPFTEEEVLSAIKKVFKEETPTIFNLEQLQVMSRGNQEFIHKMLAIFCKNSEQAIQQLEPVLKNHSFEDIKSILHKLKPSIHTLQINKGIEVISYFEGRENSEPWNEKDTKAIKDFIATLKKVNETLPCFSK